MKRHLNWFLLTCGLILVAGPIRADKLDEKRFMPVDQVKTGMTGVGKTVFSGTRIEEFQVEILGVMKNARPQGDIILARVSGGPLAETGMIQGMSGSPVYIDGRLIGATALGWSFSTQPICGITPIGEMLQLWQKMEVDTGAEREDLETPGYPGELEMPLEEGMFFGGLRDDGFPSASALAPGLVPLETPVMLSGFDHRVVAQMAPVLQKYNMIPIQAGSVSEENLEISLEPGASLAVQLVGGDAHLSAVGTLTYREGDRIMGFGHPLFTAGGVDFPMTGAYVHSVLPSQVTSFKLSSITRPVGVLRQDRRPGVAGILGQKAATLPIDLRIRDEGAAGGKPFFFEIVDDKIFSPNLVMWTTMNALMASGKAVGDATMELNLRIAIRDHHDLHIRNVFTGIAPGSVLTAELGEIVALLLRNNLERIRLESLSVDISVENRLRMARIASARANKQIVRPGEEVQVTVFLEPYRGEEQTLQTTIKVPYDTPQGRLAIQVSDATASMSWEQKRAPHRFQFRDVDQLLAVLDKLEMNDQMVVKLVMARSGAVIKGQELPSLPPSALAVLRGFQQSGEGGLTHEEVLVEKRLDTAYVLSGQIALPLTVRK